jgi:hypothetical protein
MTACTCSVRWTAWLNTQPPGPTRLFVQGHATCPTPGFTLELAPAGPQAPDSTDLRLVLRERAPSGFVPQVLSETTFRYEQPARPGQFTTVTIDGCGKHDIEVIS